MGAVCLVVFSGEGRMEALWNSADSMVGRVVL